MNKIEFYAGESLEQAYQDLQKNAPCYGVFNDKTLYSTDTIDDIFIKVTGKNKSEFDAHVREEQERIAKEKAEFQSKIPQLIDEYRQRARGIIPKKHLEYWDKIVAIRLKDLYHGIELNCWLELIEVLNQNEKSKEYRLKRCLEMFNEQGHSGMSASLVFAGLKKFHPLGVELVEYIEQN